MSHFQRLASLLLLSSFTALAQTPVPATPSPLNGTWHLVGDHEQKQFPQLSVSIQLNGSHVVAQGWIQTKCPGSKSGAGGGNFGISGDIASDGSFTLATPAASRSSTHITLNGHIPSDNSKTWSGTYRITDASPICALDEKDGFEARQLDPLNGTFTGSAFTFPGTSGNVTFTVTVAQGPAITTTIRNGTFVFYIPLTATILVKGSLCFTHGVAEASRNNSLEGELAYLNFIMNDGSVLDMSSVFMNPNERALDVFSAGVRGGKCDQNGYIHGILTRQ